MVPVTSPHHRGVVGPSRDRRRRKKAQLVSILLQPVISFRMIAVMTSTGAKPLRKDARPLERSSGHALSHILYERFRNLPLHDSTRTHIQGGHLRWTQPTCAQTTQVAGCLPEALEWKRTKAPISQEKGPPKPPSEVAQATFVGPQGEQ